MKTKIFWSMTLILATLFLAGAGALVYAQTSSTGTGNAGSTSPSSEGHFETIPAFCDSSPDHGSSTSCKEETEAANYQCDEGTKVKVTCSTGQACSENGNPGTYCNCKAKCR